MADVAAYTWLQKGQAATCSVVMACASRASCPDVDLMCRAALTALQWGSSGGKVTRQVAHGHGKHEGLLGWGCSPLPSTSMSPTLGGDCGACGGGGGGGGSLPCCCCCGGGRRGCCCCCCCCCCVGCLEFEGCRLGASPSLSSASTTGRLLSHSSPEVTPVLQTTRAWARSRLPSSRRTMQRRPVSPAETSMMEHGANSCTAAPTRTA